MKDAEWFHENHIQTIPCPDIAREDGFESYRGQLYVVNDVETVLGHEELDLISSGLSQDEDRRAILYELAKSPSSIVRMDCGKSIKYQIPGGGIKIDVGGGSPKTLL